MTEERSGALFSEIYLPPGEPRKDDPRFRRRIGLLIVDLKEQFNADLVEAVEYRLGVKVPHGGFEYDWMGFYEHAPLRDVLDSITIVHRLIVSEDRGRKGAAKQFREMLTTIFDQQHTPYRIESGGGIRYRVDGAMEANVVSMIAALNALSMKHIGKLVEEALGSVNAASPDWRSAITGIFFASEELFKLRFPVAQRLVAFEIDKHLTPVAIAAAGDDKAAKAATEKMVDSLKDWISACHDYRHAKGEPEPRIPPESLAILLTGQGIGWIRWMAQILAPTKE